VSKILKRTRKHYDGVFSPSKELKDLLPLYLNKIDKKKSKNEKQIILDWPNIIGDRLAPMTKAIEIKNKVLIVKVNNSTLHSLLSTYEKEKILNAINEKYSKNIIRDVFFRIG